MKKKTTKNIARQQLRDPNMLPALLGTFLLLFVIAVIFFAANQNMDIRSHAKGPKPPPPWKSINSNAFKNSLKTNDVNNISVQNTARQSTFCNFFGIGCH